ncbi:hypothetical protein PHMEG_00012217, partial [Phytophthora megakarya]
MDISALLSADDDGAYWEFEPFDDEEIVGGEEATVDGEDVGSETDEDAEPTTEPTQRRTGNTYVDSLIRESGLHIIREKEVAAAYKERGMLGLFSLFFTREFRDSLQTWTNKLLREKGKPEATVCEIDAYIGLEIAMSFNPVTEIKELWSQKLFMGQSDFRATMPRTRFESIRARFQIHAPDSVPVEQREQDPLWHSRRLMAQIQAKFAAIAVP